MIKKLKQGYSLGFGVDGPIGPIYQVKPGITYMAKKCNVPIIPVASAFKNKFILEKAWDKYEVPKLFTKACCVIGEPITIEGDLDKANLELNDTLNKLQLQAEEEC